MADSWGEPKSLPPAIAEHLQSRGVAPQLQALVAAACSQRGLTSHVRDYVAISPGSGGHIVGYFHPQVLSLAMPPHKAERLGAEHGWSVEPDSGITSYLRVPAAALDSPSQRSVVLALFLESVDWRAAGPFHSNGGGAGGGAPVTPIETCPVHFTQLLRGRCERCDD